MPKLNLNFYYYPSPVLFKKCSRVTKKQFEKKEELDELTTNMIDLMFRMSGQGLAASQVGISKRIFVFQPKDRTADPVICFNPRVTKFTGKYINTIEGCLSVPWVSANLSKVRNTEITIKAQNSSGKWFTMMLQDDDAFAFQHELDHLDGVLIWNKMGTAQRHRKKNKYLKNLKRFEPYMEKSEGHYFSHPEKWKEYASEA